MMIQAVLGNPNHPEYGVATIPFPVPHDQYAHCMELLEALEIGDAVKADCQMQEINSFYSVLKRMEMLTVNEELDALDGGATARQLIESGSGTITPYGVVYDNGMKLEQVYDGRSFPCYYYEPNAITVAVTAKSEPEDTEHITWLYLPMTQEEIERALQLAGITDPADVRLRLEDTQLPDEVGVLLDMEQESLADLNALAQAADEGLGKEGRAGITVSYRIGSHQPGGDRQPGLSSGTAQAGRAWDLLRRPCCTAVDKSGLRRIRSPDRHGQREPAEYVPHLRRRLCRQDVPPDGPHCPPRQCGRPVVHRRLRGNLAGCAGGLPRTSERIYDRMR